MALKWWPQSNWTRTIAELLSELRGELTSLQPMDSKDIRWNKTANGMEALLVEPPLREQAPAEEAEATEGGGGGSVGPYPAKITSGNPITGYNAQIYKNGISGAYTAGTIWLLENNTTSTLPSGTWVMATTVPMFDVGGSELMDDVLLEDA